jgi:hypothetical protein
MMLAKSRSTLCECEATAQLAVGRLSRLRVPCVWQREETLDLLVELPLRARVAGIKDELASLCLSHLQGAGSATTASPSVTDTEKDVRGDGIMGQRAVSVLEHVLKSLSESQYVVQAGTPCR